MPRQIGIRSLSVLVTECGLAPHLPRFVQIHGKSNTLLYETVINFK
jgi:hypothetical protein